MHGGDCGSSIWRSGGGPTHCLTRLAGTRSCFGGGGVAVADGDACPPAPAPRPAALLLDDAPEPGGAFLMTCCPLGENSAAAGGASDAALSTSGRSNARAAITTARLIAPGARPGRRSPRGSSRRLT